jgi:hypothetical protein
VTAEVLKGLLELVCKLGKHGGVKSRDEGRNARARKSNPRLLNFPPPKE